MLQRGASSDAARKAAPPDSPERPRPGEQSSLHDALRSVFDDRQHPEHFETGRKEAVERRIHQIAHRALGAAMMSSSPQRAPKGWPRLMVEGPPSPMTRFFVKFAIPITSCGTTWPTETTASHPFRQDVGDLDRNRLRHPPSDKADTSSPSFLGSQTCDPVPPPVPEDSVERDAGTEQQSRVGCGSVDDASRARAELLRLRRPQPAPRRGGR